jgi:hypothetical protein
MTSLSGEIVNSILNKDNINANEKIYNALYNKSSEQLLARKAEIAKHFFNPDYNTDVSDEEELTNQETED